MDALVSGERGLAVVVDQGRLLSVHAAEPQRAIPRHPGELPFLLGEARDVAVVENASLDTIARVTRLAGEQQEALQVALILLDLDLDPEIRREAASELEEMLEQADVLRFAESVLYSYPLPADADPVGAEEAAERAPAPQCQDLVRRLVALQGPIAAVREAWDSIPLAILADEADLWRQHAVREGLFRDLVTAASEERDAALLLVEASGRRAIRNLPHYREVLQAWFRPFLQRRSEALFLPLGATEPDALIDEVREPSHQTWERRFDRTAAQESVERQKESIRRAMKARDRLKVRDYVETLIAYQLEYGGEQYLAMSLCDLAMTAKQLGQTDLQLEWTQQSVELAPDDGWAWAQYADALLQSDKPYEALDAYSQADLFGESVVAATGRAEVLKALGRLDEALRAYESIYKEHPENLVARNGYAWTLASAKRFDAALALLPNAPPMAFQDWIAVHIRGMIYLRRGDRAAAIDIFENGVEQTPWADCKPYFQAALAFARLGEGESGAAAKILDNVTAPQIETPTNVLRLHAFGALGDTARASAASQAVPQTTPARVLELKAELDRRYLAKAPPEQTDEWVFEREWELLGMAA